MLRGWLAVVVEGKVQEAFRNNFQTHSVSVCTKGSNEF